MKVANLQQVANLIGELERLNKLKKAEGYEIKGAYANGIVILIHQDEEDICLALQQILDTKINRINKKLQELGVEV